MGDTECVCVPKEKYYFCFPHSPSAILKYIFKEFGQGWKLRQSISTCLVLSNCVIV